MNRGALIAQIRAKRSYLCVGLDPDPSKLPTGVDTEAFLSAIIGATAPYAVAYKPNLAFFEAMGAEGWAMLKRLIAEIPKGFLVIADAKRGDIGNTARMYARAMFDDLGAHAVTLSPYMGRDAIEPFLGIKDRWAVVLGLTSNPGAEDFETQLLADGKPLYQRVVEQVASWGSMEDTMFVVGATRPDQLAEIRALVPHHFFLVPGVGAQGGSLQEVSNAGLTEDCGLLVNSSRGILYASSGSDFAQAAGRAAKALQLEMSDCLDSFPSR